MIQELASSPASAGASCSLDPSPVPPPVAVGSASSLELRLPWGSRLGYQRGSGKVFTTLTKAILTIFFVLKPLLTNCLHTLHITMRLP